MKAEHFERQLQRAESERDAMEKKYEVSIPLKFGASGSIELIEHQRRVSFFSFGLDVDHQDAMAKYQQSKKELDELVISMEGI